MLVLAVLFQKILQSDASLAKKTDGLARPLEQMIARKIHKETGDVPLCIWEDGDWVESTLSLTRLRQIREQTDDWDLKHNLDQWIQGQVECEQEVCEDPDPMTTDDEYLPVVTYMGYSRSRHGASRNPNLARPQVVLYMDDGHVYPQIAILDPESLPDHAARRMLWLLHQPEFWGYSIDSDNYWPFFQSMNRVPVYEGTWEIIQALLAIENAKSQDQADKNWKKMPEHAEEDDWYEKWFELDSEISTYNEYTELMYEIGGDEWTDPDVIRELEERGMEINEITEHYETPRDWIQSELSWLSFREVIEKEAEATSDAIPWNASVKEHRSRDGWSWYLQDSSEHVFAEIHVEDSGKITWSASTPSYYGATRERPFHIEPFAGVMMELARSGYITTLEHEIEMAGQPSWSLGALEPTTEEMLEHMTNDEKLPSYMSSQAIPSRVQEQLRKKLVGEV